MPMRVGAQGIVLGGTSDKLYVKIRLAGEWSTVDKVNGDIGWVPSSWLKVGIRRKHGQTRITRQGVELARLSSSLKFTVDVSGLDPVTALLTNAFTGMWEARQLLTFFPDENWNALRDVDGPRKMAILICNGIRKAAPRYYEALNGNANLELRDVQKWGRAQEESDNKRVIIYSIAYFFKLKDNKKKDDAQYIGYTAEGLARDVVHEKDILDGKNYHYRYARGHDEKSNRVLCEFEDQELGKKIGPWAEQALILLTQSQAFFCKAAQTSVALDSLQSDELGEASDPETAKSEAADMKIQARLLIEASLSST